MGGTEYRTYILETRYVQFGSLQIEFCLNDRNSAFQADPISRKFIGWINRKFCRTLSTRFFFSVNSFLVSSCIGSVIDTQLVHGFQVGSTTKSNFLNFYEQTGTKSVRTWADIEPVWTDFPVYMSTRNIV